MSEEIMEPVEPVKKTKKKKKATVYTVAEFMEVPAALEAAPDIIRAAFKVAGVTEATLDEALKIVKDFKKREVK